MDMDAIDTLAAQAFDGFIVRKDLVRRFKNQYPVPTYVVEFLLGRYCASVDEQEIQDGLPIVQRQLVDRAVRAGTEELFKSRAREKGSVKIIDLVTARLDARSDAYVVVTSLFPSSIWTCGVERLVVSCDARFPVLRRAHDAPYSLSSALVGWRGTASARCGLCA